MLPYIISPVLMRGTVSGLDGDFVKLNLQGRLGVLTVPRSLLLTEAAVQPGALLQFYFSYLEVDDVPRDYDLTELRALRTQEPVPVGGILTEVNDTAVKCTLPENFGTVAVPRRWVFTNHVLRAGQTAGFYLSPMTMTRCTPA